METPGHLIGVESKRHEPFRDRKAAKLSSAYDRDVWGDGMGPWTAMRDRLRDGPTAFRHPDAAQLVIHAFGLIMQARRIGKLTVLVHLYAEPTDRPVVMSTLERHRHEADDFTATVSGAAVRLAARCRTDWLARFKGEAADHADGVQGLSILEVHPNDPTDHLRRRR